MGNRTATLQQLLTLDAVAHARELLRARAADAVGEMCELVAVPAPPFGEAERSAWFAGRLRAAGYAPVTDELGNVITATGPLADCIVVAAHLDTVFAADTPLAPARRDGRIYAPGISDNVRGLAAVLALGRVLAEAPLDLGRTVA